MIGIRDVCGFRVGLKRCENNCFRFFFNSMLFKTLEKKNMYHVE